MSIHMQATIEPNPEGLPQLLAVLAEMVGILEAEGWRLAGAFQQRSGRLQTIIDLWELDDYNHYARGLQALSRHARFPAIAQVLAANIRSETLVFLDKAPYMRQAAGSAPEGRKPEELNP